MERENTEDIFMIQRFLTKDTENTLYKNLNRLSKL